MNDAERTIKLDLRELPISVAKKRPVLVILQGHSIGQTINLDQERTVVGRGSQVDLVLRDEIASRQHAEVIRLNLDGGCVEYYLNDLASTNGTFLNGAKVASQQLLQDGDKIKVGNHLMKFALLDEFEAEFQEKLHQMTQRDELTGLRSRRSLFADLDRKMTEVVKTGELEQISVLMMDIDFFKRVNDGRGHLVGSHTIRDVGHIIRDVVGSPDLAARYGGEEYMAYVIGQSDRGLEVAEAIRRAVEAHPFPASTNDLAQTMHITISLGVATFPKDGSAALEIVQKADQALFRAKLSGRNRTCVYDPAIDKSDTFHPAVDASAIIYGPADAQ
ncbi:MAG TPA: GGDEF domain-containing protein [Blastocatellia bacterium]|nr:GGDEF domain-containing protein [Blastocatellia bacterium]